MESENSVILESCGEDSILIQTVKDMVTENTCPPLENEEEEFFVITDVQNEQQNVTEASNEGSIEAQCDEFCWSTLCRVCAHSCDHLIPIFEGEGLQHDLCSKIHKYLPIHVSEVDTLPVQLCYHCAATLLAWHELLEGCLGAEKKLLEMQNVLQEKKVPDILETSTQDMTVSNVAECLQQQQENMKDEPPEDSAVNNLDRFALSRKISIATCCDETIAKEIKTENTNKSDDKATLSARCNTDSKMVKISFPNLNSKEKIDLPKNKYMCEKCGRIFKREYYSTRHISKCKGEIKEETNTLENRSPKVKDGKSEVKQNEENQEESEIYTNKRFGTYPCGHCDHVSKHKRWLMIHINKSHPQFAKKKKFKYADFDTVIRAKKEEDGKVYYHCDECGKDLYSPYTYYWHTRIHTGERPFICAQCGKQFRVYQGLSRHLNTTHATTRNFTCDICGRKFATKRNVKDHMRVHMDERPFVCKVCGTAFKHRGALHVHNNIHSDVYPYECSFCKQRFHSKPPLVAHVTKHTGEKPHACDLCSRRFRIKHEMKRHRLIHFDFKPFKCSDCDVAYRQKRYLTLHRRIHH